MKLGQALSVFEAALPEEIAAPYRAALVKLQEAAPPMPARPCTRCSPSSSAAPGGERFARVRRPARRGGQHRAGAPGHLAGRPGRRRQDPVPGRRHGADVRPQPAGRLARLFAVLCPGMDVKPLIAELQARVAEELDYGLEADWPSGPSPQHTRTTRTSSSRGRGQFTEGSSSPSGSRAPAVADHRRRHARSSATAPGYCSCASPSPAPPRAGLLHADPHPGNFRLMLDDGRLGRHRLRRGQPAARRPPRADRPARPPRAATATGKPSPRPARGGVRPARHRGRRPGRARLPGPPARTARARRSSTSPATGCRRRPPGSATRAPRPASWAGS